MVSGFADPGSLPHADRLTIAQRPPWLVVGKGPTFGRLSVLEPSQWQRLALNHAALACDPQLAHVIDLDVISAEFLQLSCPLIVPWHLHIDSRPTDEPLSSIARRHCVLAELAHRGQLFWYDSYTWGGPHQRPDAVVDVRSFSAEAAFGLLARAGVLRISSVGVDGGRDYHDTFAGLEPLTNGRPNFDDGIRRLHVICREQRIRWRRV